MRSTIYNAAILCVGVALALYSCKTMTPSGPAEHYLYTPVQPETSVINLHADLEVARLEQLLNEQIDTLLYDDKSLTDNNGDNLMVKAWKSGNIKVSLRDDQLSWEVPLKLNIKKAIAIFAFNLPVVDALEAKGELVIRFKTKLAVNPDWSITTSTTADGYRWVKKPTIQFSGITIPVTPVADMLLKNNQDQFSRQIDQSVSSLFDLQQLAEKGWQTLHKPVKIPGEYNAWLAARPYSIALKPLRGTDGFIRFRMAITADIECLLDRQPTAAKPTSLPVIKPLEQESDSFRLNLLTDIPWQTIERLTMETIADSVFTFGKRSLSFDSMRIYGTNGRLAIETSVKGSITGTMYLTGVPYFNEADTTLRVKELKFDLKTRNLWTKSADWLFSGLIERTITEAFAIPFSSDVRSLERQLTGYLTNYNLGYGFEANGQLNKMTVSDIVLTPESVKANIVFSGKLSFAMGDLITPTR